MCLAERALKRTNERSTWSMKMGSPELHAPQVCTLQSLLADCGLSDDLAAAFAAKTTLAASAAHPGHHVRAHCRPNELMLRCLKNETDGHAMAIELQLTGVSRNEPSESECERRLTRAVGPGNGEDAARNDLEVQVVLRE